MPKPTPRKKPAKPKRIRVMPSKYFEVTVGKLSGPTLAALEAMRANPSVIRHQQLEAAITKLQADMDKALKLLNSIYIVQGLHAYRGH